MIISSQRYLNDEIVNEKLENNDFVVTLSPVFEIDGEEYQVMTDGHHSFEAAKIKGVEPKFVVEETQDNDRIALIEDDIDSFLESNWVDSDWYNVETGINIF